MNKNLLWQLVLIVGVLLVFLFGIFGIPQSFSGQGLLASMTNRIHLGLDLRGGTHLILQVQVNDAINVDSDNAVEILKEQLNKRKIAFADISKPDPQNNPDRIVLKGVPADSRKDLLDIANDRLPEYNLTSGAENTWALAMKPQILSDLKNKAVTQAIETIRNRIDSLGVSEPTIQEHGLGQYQILVQLPGVDDPARVKDIMQSTAMLEIKQVCWADLIRASRLPCRIRAEFCRRMRFCCRGMVLPELLQANRPGIWCRAFPRSEEKICAMRSPAPIRTVSRTCDSS